MNLTQLHNKRTALIVANTTLTGALRVAIGELSGAAGWLEASDQKQVAMGIRETIKELEKILEED